MKPRASVQLPKLIFAEWPWSGSASICEASTVCAALGSGNAEDADALGCGKNLCLCTHCPDSTGSGVWGSGQDEHTLLGHLRNPVRSFLWSSAQPVSWQSPDPGTKTPGFGQELCMEVGSLALTEYLRKLLGKELAGSRAYLVHCPESGRVGQSVCSLVEPSCACGKKDRAGLGFFLLQRVTWWRRRQRQGGVFEI